MRGGLALVAAATPLQLAFAGIAGAAGFFLSWLLVPAGLLLCRAEPSLARGVRPALVAWGAAAAAGILGVGLTIGTAQGALADVGGAESGLAGLSIFFLAVAPLPLAVLLAATTDGAARGAARLAAFLLAVPPPLAATLGAYPTRPRAAPAVPSLLLALALLGIAMAGLSLFIGWLDRLTPSRSTA
ncbi:MAG: hypothetical protein LC624_03720 [Halobacteriales archaeon]|nr:hypothetical protein [Halobacteriales archaeon]